MTGGEYARIEEVADVEDEDTMLSLVAHDIDIDIDEDEDEDEDEDVGSSSLTTVLF